MLLRFVGIVVILLGFIALVVAAHRWSERMLARVNAKRPADDQLKLLSGALFHSWTLQRAFRQNDPGEYWRATVGFGICALLLIAAMWWLMSGLGK
jgi:hypothetical protein